LAGCRRAAHGAEARRSGEPSAAAIDPDAQIILGKGRWGLVTEDLSAAAVAKARLCAGPVIAFTFTGSEVQRITQEGGEPPKGPPDVFADLKAEKDNPYTAISLFAARGDAKPAATYSYDPSVETLMLLGPDGDGTHLYALCTG
jgi:hypothetical protein